LEELHSCCDIIEKTILAFEKPAVKA